MKSRIAIFAAILLAGSLAFSGQEAKSLILSAEGIDKLEIDCGAGFLKVQGREGLHSIEVKAEIFVRGVDDEDMKSFIEGHVKLTLEKEGSRAVLVSEVKDGSIFSFRDARIDLTVNVPRKMDLGIDDGSGSIDLVHIMGNVIIDDGSGDIQVEDIQGNLEIDDGSGEIEVRTISGDVAIDDGSGSLSAYDIGGSLTVDDGSGSIDVDGVAKDLVLKETGSGSLHFRNIKGQVIK
jgi:DUF4097 and DUF4098 domain-containing protein YvlB